MIIIAGDLFAPHIIPEFGQYGYEPIQPNADAILASIEDSMPLILDELALEGI